MGKEAVCTVPLDGYPGPVLVSAPPPIHGGDPPCPSRVGELESQAGSPHLFFAFALASRSCPVPGDTKSGVDPRNGRLAVRPNDTCCVVRGQRRPATFLPRLEVW